MVILGIESSAVSASAALVKDGKLISEAFLNVGLTHSVTLLPLIRQVVDGAAANISDIDAVAVSNGPGSFTGVRIGVATAKGIAQPENKKCVPLSTLEVIVYPLADNNCIAVPVMDARCNQVYCALFDCYDGMKRIAEDDAITLDKLAEKLSEYSDKKLVLIGDGADISYKYLCDKLNNIHISSPLVRYQRASSVALLANDKLIHNESVTSASELVPSYLRLSQAERELKKKKES